MIPITFEGCFGWLHPDTSARGVILCSPHGSEKLYLHRVWYGLGESLAIAGMPTVRFDYRGTGHSTEDDETPGRVQARLDSRMASDNWLKDRDGVTEVGLVS